MNGWDLFTWAMIAILAVGSIGVFAGFVRDLRGMLRELDVECAGHAGAAGRQAPPGEPESG